MPALVTESPAKDSWGNMIAFESLRSRQQCLLPPETEGNGKGDGQQQSLPSSRHAGTRLCLRTS
eukprot:1458442-Amphidinium_carterae.1